MNDLYVQPVLFFCLLCGSAWQDIRYRGIWGWFYILLGFLSAGYCVWAGREWTSVCISVGVGVCLLLFGKLTGEELGEGDGWFFVVSGLLLPLKMNLLLLISGLFFCGIYSLTLAAAGFVSHVSVRRMRLPFLPFLLPAGLGMVFF